jgi:hypothetical protein
MSKVYQSLRKAWRAKIQTTTPSALKNRTHYASFLAVSQSLRDSKKAKNESRLAGWAIG